MARPFLRLARKTIARWREWRFERALPEVAALKRERDAKRRDHRSTREIERALRSLITARLKLEADHASR